MHQQDQPTDPELYGGRRITRNVAGSHQPSVQVVQAHLCAVVASPIGAGGVAVFRSVERPLVVLPSLVHPQPSTLSRHTIAQDAGFVPGAVGILLFILHHIIRYSTLN